MHPQLIVVLTGLLRLNDGERLSCSPPNFILMVRSGMNEDDLYIAPSMLDTACIFPDNLTYIVEKNRIIEMEDQ